MSKTHLQWRHTKGLPYVTAPLLYEKVLYMVVRNGGILSTFDWEVRSSGDLAEQVIATPAIADGRIYVRTEGTLYCFGAKTR